MAHPVDIHVGKRLRLRRTLLGMSQESIGKEIGVTFQQIQKYERGMNRIGASRLFDFSRVMNVPIAYFFEGYGDESKQSAANGGMAEQAQPFEYEALSDRETLELVRAFKRVGDPDVRKRIFELVKSLSDTQS